MIEFFNGKYKTHRDGYQWILSEKYEGKTRDGEPVDKWRDTYHATLEQVCRTVLDREAGQCDTAKAIMDLFIEAAGKVEDYVSARPNT